MLENDTFGLRSCAMPLFDFYHSYLEYCTILFSFSSLNFLKAW